MDFQPMSPEEIQRTMQFLLHQQAKFDANFERLSEKTERIADALIGLTGIVGRLSTAQDRTDQQLRETDRQVHETSRLFERHLREDHGKPS